MQHADADVAAEEAARASQTVGDHEVVAEDGGVLTPERRVEQADVVGHRSERQVELVVQLDVTSGVVRQLDAEVTAERHRDPRVEPPPFLRALEGRRVRHGPPVYGAEEVGKWHGHARFGRVVVVHLDDDGPQPIGPHRRNREPQVSDDAGAVDVGEHDPFTGHDRAAG